MAHIAIPRRELAEFVASGYLEAGAAQCLALKPLDEGRRLEFYAAIYFAAAYRRAFAQPLKLIAMATPPEPDFIARLRTCQIGIEVAHLFGSDRDARLLLGRTQPSEITCGAWLQHARVPLSHRVPIELSKILAQKGRKAYPRPTWLLIRNAYPLWDRADFENYREDLLVPTTHPFKQVWLLCDRDGSSGMMRLS